MDRFESRRAKLRALIDRRFGGISADLARATGIDASYVTRMLYPPGKSGRKRIGEDLVQKIEATLAIPGYFDGVPAASQPVREQRDTMRAAARIMERAREVIIGDYDEDALIDSALDAAEEIGPEKVLSGDGLLEALRSVAARLKAA